MSVVLFFFSMILLPPISICTVTLFPYTTLFVDAQLLGQPDVAVGAGDGDRVGDIVDDIMLLDIVRLALPEDAADKAHPRVSGRGDARLEEALLIAVDAMDILIGADRIVVVVADIRGVSI